MNSLLVHYLKSKRVQKALSTRPGEEGFSLVELVIVIAVLAILAAIAIPAFQGVQSQAKIASVKSGLVNGVKECVVSAAVNVGDASATLFEISQAFKGDYAGYTVRKYTGPGSLNPNSCYQAEALSNDGSTTNFQIIYNPNTGISQKWCQKGVTGCKSVDSDNMWK